MRNDARQNGMVASREKCLLQMFLRILLYLFNSIAKTAVDLLLLLVVWIRRRVRERDSDDDDIEMTRIEIQNFRKTLPYFFKTLNLKRTVPAYSSESIRERNETRNFNALLFAQEKNTARLHKTRTITSLYHATYRGERISNLSSYLL